MKKIAIAKASDATDNFRQTILDIMLYILAIVTWYPKYHVYHESTIIIICFSAIMLLLCGIVMPIYFKRVQEENTDKSRYWV